MPLGTPVVYASTTPMVSPEALEVMPVSTTTIKAAVTHAFGTSSIMVRVAACESRYRQFGDDGEPLRGAVNPKDVGVFQINERWHLEESLRQDIDIYTLAGNIDYAKRLYAAEGTTPWNASRYCWGELASSR